MNKQTKWNEYNKIMPMQKKTTATETAEYT